MSKEVEMTLDMAVAEVSSLLNGIELTLDHNQERYRVIARFINHALRDVALELEWSYYSDYEIVGTAHEGLREVHLRKSLRPRVINDDAVRLVDGETKETRFYAYFLPRDSLGKHGSRPGLWVAAVRDTLSFSRYFNSAEAGLEIHVPVMREPRMFQVAVTEGPSPIRLGGPAAFAYLDDAVRSQKVDFDYPDLVVMRAAYLYAQTDPLMQPRVQTLEANYKDRMYSLKERDERSTDASYVNDFSMGIESSLNGQSDYPDGRALADERGFYGW